MAGEMIGAMVGVVGWNECGSGWIEWMAKLDG
jgi:hypothetical protein